MSSSLVRGKYVIGKAACGCATAIEDGAVYQVDGIVRDVGSFAELARKYRPDAVHGSPGHVVLPGFVNSHHHLGLTPLQMGSPDLPLELWWVSRLSKRNIDIYLDTLHAAFEMIESGITTVQHLHSRINGPLENIVDAACTVIRAYCDIGMRVSYAYGIREQNRMVYEADEKFVARLPPGLSQDVDAMLKAQVIPLEDNFALFETLYRKYEGSDRVRIQLAPTNLHWCSDRCLSMVRDYADRYDVPIHMHLLESAFQRQYAKRRTSGSAVRHLRELGLLSPRMTLGHGVWLTDADIGMIAESGTRICHNPSSNLRLRSGIAPINRYRQLGVPVALGLDEAGINDDKDMLQEMRLALNLHRVPGMDDSVPTPDDVFCMCTEHGAETTGFGTTIGALDIGRAADMVLMDWKQIAYPYLDAAVPPLHGIVQRAKKSGVDAVMIGGEMVFEGGRFTRIDKAKVLEEIARSLAGPLTAQELGRVDLSKRLMPHARQFYRDEGYEIDDGVVPFYVMNGAR